MAMAEKNGKAESENQGGGIPVTVDPAAFRDHIQREIESRQQEIGEHQKVLELLDKLYPPTKKAKKKGMSPAKKKALSEKMKLKHALKKQQGQQAEAADQGASLIPKDPAKAAEQAAGTVLSADNID